MNFDAWNLQVRARLIILLFERAIFHQNMEHPSRETNQFQPKNFPEKNLLGLGNDTAHERRLMKMKWGYRG